MKRHSAEEISSKLREAVALMERGHSQAQACKMLGVSVMTLHRWRKHESNQAGQLVVGSAAQPPEEGQAPELDPARIDELRLENERLRRIVTDLLLEKMKMEEKIALQARLQGKSARER